MNGDSVISLMSVAMHGSLVVVAGGLFFALIWFLVKTLIGHFIAVKIERAARRKWGRQAKPEEKR